jgi:ribosomal protein S27AE
MRKKISEFLISFFALSMFLLVILGLILWLLFSIFFEFGTSFLLSLTIILILSTCILSLPKKTYYKECPKCGATIDFFYDQYKRRYFQCDKCGYFEYHIPGPIKGKIIKNKKPKILKCSYCKWKKGKDQPLWAHYSYSESSRLRNMGGFVCPECGYDLRGWRCNINRGRIGGKRYCFQGIKYGKIPFLTKMWKLYDKCRTCEFFERYP